MVVDDEPFVRLSIASLANWEDEGFDFSFEASNGEDALARLVLHPEIDIVLLDLSMPVMDGIEFLKRLRPLERDDSSAVRGTPAVIVLSAHDDFHLVREAFKLGAGDYLLKAELDAESLRAALAKAVSGLSGLSEPRDRSVDILERRQLESLKAQVLRDLLAGPPADEIAESFAFLGISLESPFRVVSVWIEDFDAVEQLWKDEGLARFSDMLYRSLSQVLSSRYRGEVLLLSPSHAVAFVSAGPDPGEDPAAAFCEDAKEYLERYLSIRSVFSASAVCAGPEEAAAAYRASRATRSVESRIVILAKRAIRERFADPAFSLDEAGSRAGVSPNHLSFEFSRETGETFISYLSRVRMEEAKRLLSSTDLMVYEVAERVGYPSVEHFSRTFKRMVGSSPARYKTMGGADGASQG
jgi:two-component system response regulator YesN